MSRYPNDDNKYPTVNLPNISVVTVVFNGAAYIRNTVESVLNQTYNNIEYIIIDGGSTDGTMNIIAEYGERFSYVLSESDDGIYDAMNKGLAKATGEWICFMNAGDEFVRKDTVSEVAHKLDLTTGVLYGGVEIRYLDYQRVEMPGQVQRLWAGMQFSHQSAFINNSYHKAHPYSMKYPVAADLHFMYQAYSTGVTFKNLGHVVASVNTGGVSEANRVRTILESADAVCGSSFRPMVRIFYFLRAVDAWVRGVIKRMLPAAAVRSIILLKK